MVDESSCERDVNDEESREIVWKRQVWYSAIINRIVDTSVGEKADNKTKGFTWII